jgi:hypothetical protein
MYETLCLCTHNHPVILGHGMMRAARRVISPNCSECGCRKLRLKPEDRRDSESRLSPEQFLAKKAAERRERQERESGLHWTCVACHTVNQDRFQSCGACGWERAKALPHRTHTENLTMLEARKTATHRCVPGPAHNLDLINQMNNRYQPQLRDGGAILVTKTSMGRGKVQRGRGGRRKFVRDR